MKKLLSILIIGAGFSFIGAMADEDKEPILKPMIDEITKQKTLVQEHFSGKVEETIEFQKNGWEQGKIQLVNNWNTILEFFTSK